jgi:Holliday junction resolvase
VTNRNYAKGASDERAVRVLAESVGCEVIRAAGSHGTDLVVADGLMVYALDVKRNRWAGPGDRMAMAKAWEGKAVPWLVMVRAGPGHAREYSYRRVLADGSLGQVTDLAPWK